MAQVNMQLKVQCDRFYARHTKERVTTAWSLAGAWLFLEGTAYKIYWSKYQRRISK